MSAGDVRHLHGLVLVRYGKSPAHGGMGLHLEALDRSLADQADMDIYRLYPPDGATSAREPAPPCRGPGRVAEVALTGSGFPGARYAPVHLVRSFLHALDAIRRAHPGRTVLVLNHLADMPESFSLAVLLRWRRLPWGIVHHSGNQDPTANVALAASARLAHGVGGVTLRGLRRTLGASAWELGNGIDVDFFDAQGLDRGGFRGTSPWPGEEVPLVVVPARVCGYKRQHDILEAVRRLRRDPAVPDFRVAFVGDQQDPAYLDRLNRQARRSGLNSHVAFLGWQGRQRLRQAYADADIGLLASSKEGLPRVVLEMGAMGLPVVAADAGGTRDAMEPGRSGILVRPGRPGELAAALRELLLDPERRARLGQNGRELVRRRFSLAALAARHVAFYRHILSRAGCS